MTRLSEAPLRVLQVIPSVAPRYGGPSAAVLGMNGALRASGVQSLIATTDADGAGQLAVPLAVETTYEGEPTIFFRRRLSEAFKWSGALAAWLTRHVRDFDVVHIHAVFSHAPIVAGRVCRRRHVPYVVRPLGTLDPWSLGQKQWRKRVLYPLGVHELLVGAAAMHYTTDEERRLVESAQRGLARGVVVPIGVPEICFRAAMNAQTSQSRYALVLSRLDRKKRLEWVIRAWHHLASTDRLGEWRLVIAGEGDEPYVSQLYRLASDGRAADRISFLGWVGGRRKADLLAGASLFLLPSHQENFGVSIVEAMASGVPPVVTPGVNLGPEVAAAQAGWVAGDSPQAFEDLVARVISSEAERVTVGRHARAFAERFRWASVATQLVSLYESLAAPEDALVGARAGRPASVTTN